VLLRCLLRQNSGGAQVQYSIQYVSVSHSSTKGCTVGEQEFRALVMCDKPVGIVCEEACMGWGERGVSPAVTMNCVQYIPVLMLWRCVDPCGERLQEYEVGSLSTTDCRNQCCGSESRFGRILIRLRMLNLYAPFLV
jgi:hypothetical protein